MDGLLGLLIRARRIASVRLERVQALRLLPAQIGQGASFGVMHMYRRSGFTLIELMVVVIIIAALAGMILPRLWPATDSAKRKIARGDMAGIQTALTMYRLHSNRFPTTEEGLNILLSPGTTKDWKEPYLEKKPDDPWGRAYQYRCPGSHNTRGVDIWSLGPDGKESDDDVNNWSTD